MADIDDLIELGAAVPADPWPRPAQPGRAPGEDAVAHEIPEIADLIELEALAVAEAPARRHAQRSWTLMEKARSAKERRRLEGLWKAEGWKRQKLEHLADVIGVSFPMVARAVGLPAKHSRMDADRCVVLMKLAAMPAMRGVAAYGASTQARAAALMAAAVQRLQRDFFRQACAALPALEDSIDRLNIRPLVKVIALDWQWDETSQRVKGSTTHGQIGERVSASATSCQIMMQSGAVRVYVWNRVSLEQTTSDPIFARGLNIAGQSANHILEGLTRMMPLDLFCAESMNMATQGARHVFVNLCCDRASANFAAASAMWRSLQTPQSPRALIPHLEPCAAHAVALCKTRPRAFADDQVIVTAVHSFACFMRFWKNAQAFRDEVIRLVSAHLVVNKGARPPPAKAKSHRLLQLLYGPADATFLDRRDAQGEARTKPFFDDLQTLANTLDLGLGGVESLAVWTGDLPEIATHDGLRGGHDHALERSLCVEAASMPIVNLLVGRMWDSSSMHRWTYITKSLKKVALGCLCKGILPAALQNLQLFFEVNLGMEATLEKMIEADTGNFTAKTKLRLLRITRCFAADGFSWRVAVLISSLAPMDDLLYGILGDGTPSSRLNLRSLLAEATSPISSIQQCFLRALQDFTLANEFWLLFFEMGGAFAEESCRRFVRRQLLQLSAALLQYFEARLSCAPYTLIKLADEGIPLPRRQRIAWDFLAVPAHCLTLLGARLKEAYPTPDALIAGAALFVPAWTEGEGLAIDASERSHASMRLDLRSTGAGRNFTHSSNRTLCAQVAASHRRRGGLEPTLKPTPLASADAQGGDGSDVGGLGERRPRKSRGGLNPFLTFQNHSLATWKSAFAPTRAMTSAERDNVLAGAKRDWLKMSAAEQAEWKAIWRADMAARAIEPLALGDDARGDAEKQTPFRGLWQSGQDSDKSVYVPPDALMQTYTEQSATSRRAIALHDPALFVASEVQQRTRPGLEPSLFGCFANKRNICKASLDRRTAAELESLARQLSAWTDSLGDRVAGSADNLLWLKGSTLAGDRLDMCLLLVDSVRSPKCQYFARCCLKDHEGQVLFRMPDAWPVVMSVANREARLSPSFRTLDVATSDEVCHEVVSERRCRGMTWELVPLKWEFAEGPSLLDMKITGTDEPFTALIARAPSAKPLRNNVEEATLDLDPWSHGRQSASRAPLAPTVPRELGSADYAESADVAIHDDMAALGLGPDSEADAFAILGDAVMGDMREALADAEDETEFFKAMTADTSEPANGAREADDAESDPEAELAIAAEAAGISAEPASAPPPELSPADCSRLARTNGDGYVSLGVAPWNRWPYVGRVTSWPASKPMSSRSCSVKCYIHPGCSSPAKRRRAIADETFLLWLFKAPVPEPDANRDRIVALGVAHRAMWDEVLNNVAAAPLGEAIGASSSSNALVA